MRRRSSSAVAAARVRWASPLVMAATGEFMVPNASFCVQKAVVCGACCVLFPAILTQDLYTIYDLARKTGGRHGGEGRMAGCLSGSDDPVQAGLQPRRGSHPSGP